MVHFVMSQRAFSKKICPFAPTFKKLQTVVSSNILYNVYIYILGRNTEWLCMFWLLIPSGAKEVLLVIGGFGSQQSPIDIVEKYDPKTQEWTFLPVSIIFFCSFPFFLSLCTFFGPLGFFFSFSFNRTLHGNDVTSPPCLSMIECTWSEATTDGPGSARWSVWITLRTRTGSGTPSPPWMSAVASPVPPHLEVCRPHPRFSFPSYRSSQRTI